MTSVGLQSTATMSVCDLRPPQEAAGPSPSRRRRVVYGLVNQDLQLLEGLDAGIAMMDAGIVVRWIAHAGPR